ncbi:hypothetical protein PGT21_010577 [Puccinia graminis f. sp. tritici]|uniref:Uncharacterized protein n=1 Tax=Puccinia graminis f. sp. tritici TaxID=56615 RepID=A0A5B0QHU7_PUCGR|nr:hypothetical protein PGT21_010577 [Puccinia graminis f. sp. tritici]
MIEDLKSYKWMRLKAQVILRPFGSNKRKNTAGTFPSENLNSDDDETDVDPDDPDEQIQFQGFMQL